MKTTFCKLLLAAGLLLAPSSAFAVGETYGRVSGYVYDPTGAPLSEVPLTISGTSLIKPINRTSGEDGRYEFDQLPPGEDYQIEVQVPGFTPIRQKGIKVHLGQTTPADINLTVMTETGAAAQTFQIIEKVNPVLNPDTAQATTVVTAEKAAETPQFTQTEGIPQQVAGTTFSNKPSSRGGFSRYGKFYVDGLDTTDITDGSITGLVNFFTVDNWEVVTGGFDAEYNSLGMVENVVTKSGSNRFTYDAVLTLSPPFLTAQNNVPSPSPAYIGPYTNSPNPPPQTTFYSPILSVGGPIVPDFLWFYASGQVNYSDRETPLSTFYNPLVSNRPTITWTGIGRLKLTMQATSKDRVSLTYNLDHNTIDNSTGSSSVTEDAETKINRGGSMIVLNYDHNFTDNVLFRLQAGATIKNVDNDPEHQSGAASHFDSFNSVSTTNAGRLAFGQDENYLHEAKTRFQFDPSMIFKLGEHQMKAGVQFSYMLDSQTQGVTGDSRYTDHGGNCDPTNPATTGFCFERTDFYANANTDANGQGTTPGGPMTMNASALNLGAYIQDRWNVNRKLTVVPGIRFDYGNMLGDPNQPGTLGPTLFGVGPRLSTTYDLFGDRKALITGHLGRSNDVGNVFIAQHGNPTLLEVNSFYTAGAFPGCSPDPTVNAAINATAPGSCSVAGGSTGRSFLLSNGSRSQAPPYVDEAQLGWHQEAMPQTAYGVDLDYRHYGKEWVDQEVNRIWDPSGTKIIGYQNGTPQSILVSRTTPAAFRNYEGVDLWVQGNPGRWDLYVAYTLSFSHGTVNDYFDGYMADVRMNQFSNGWSSDDHRHTFKGSIAYTFPWGLDIGVRARYQTGGSMWETFANAADSNLNFYRSPRGTGYPINVASGLPNLNDPTQWAEQRTPDWFQIDLQARYNLGALLGLTQKLEVTAFVLDSLNDYNAGSETSFYSTAKGGGTCAVTPPNPGSCVNKYGLASFRNGPLQGEVIIRFRN